VTKTFFLPEEESSQEIERGAYSFGLERNLTKEDPFLYSQQYLLGNESWGRAASESYFKNEPTLQLPEIAMLAGLVKAPSRIHL
jgi:membrane carboxypeptidase/penicillin-binding protein